MVTCISVLPFDGLSYCFFCLISVMADISMKQLPPVIIKFWSDNLAGFASSS